MRFLHHTKLELARERERFNQPNNSIQFTKDNEYYTPKKIVKYFGDFDYDPATTKEKAEEFGVTNYDTIETDGLKTDWNKYKRIWINPPFSEKHKFVEKAYKTYKESKGNIYILFPIEFLTTRRFHNAAKGLGGKIYIPSGRIPFESGLGKQGKSPAFGSVILKIQDKWEVEMIDIESFDYKQLSMEDIWKQ
jgi:phage N-6-adenine-methyltransferase